jgi:N-acetylglucosamine kinase-like BadF-type ATPase
MKKTPDVPLRAHIVGVDGGGSKTRALVADLKGNLLGEGVAGPSNYQAVGRTAAYRAIDHAIQAATEGAGVTGAPRAICLGLAGVGRPRDREVFHAWAVARYPNVPILVDNDSRLVLAAGTPEGWGIALIGGTGSIAYGRDPSGHIARAGGWGYIFGDEGSGYALGVAALRAIAQAADGRAAPTSLTDAVLAHWSLEHPQALIPRVYQGVEDGGHSREWRLEIAELAVLVKRAAVTGDAVAQDIVREAGRALALLIAAVARNLTLTPPIPCAFAGSVIVKGQAVYDALLSAAEDLELRLNPVTLVPDPAQGALRLARSLIKEKT